MKKILFSAIFSFIFLTGIQSLFAQADITPPAIQSLDFAPNTIDVSGGSQTVTGTVRVTDDLSGLSSGYVSLRSPSLTQQRGGGFGYWSIISGNMNDGVYQFEITIPQYSEAGEWRIDYIGVYDNVGNGRGYYTAELVTLGFPTVVTVIENQNPVADAGPDKTALVKEQIHFDGSQSSDSDGYVTAWVWDFGDGSPTATGTLVSYAYAQPGQYTVTLTVTDNEGGTAVDQSLVVVKAPIAAVGDLIADVESGTSSNQQKSLLSKLNSVLDSLKKENDGAAINKLMLFIAEVQAQKGKKIPGDVADRWIALANRIIAAVQAGANTLQVSTIDALTRAESSNLLESPGHTVVEMPGLAIRLRIEEPGALTVAITDSKGSLVGLVYGRFEKAGDCVLLWNGRDLQGNPCPKGVYCYQALGSFRPNMNGVIIIR